MKRYIDAVMLENALFTPHIYDINRDDVIALISEQPTADVVEVKHGKWIVDGDITECSNCHKEYVTARGMLQLKEFEHCPRCGTKMDGEIK